MARAPIVLPIRIALGGQAVQTTTRELSSEGVFVRCLQAPKVGSHVTMKLYLPGSPLAEAVAGIVRENSGEGGDAGFWAEFVSLRPAERERIVDLLERRARASSPAPPVPIGAMELMPAAPAAGAPPAVDARRTFPRYDARFAVRFATVQDFVLEYAANISAGGVFVVTDNPPALETIVHIAMELPGSGPPVEAKAVVVHRVTPEAAKERNTPPGVGVQFVDADDVFRARLDQAIEVILQSG